jgi:hypothetical protein
MDLETINVRLGHLEEKLEHLSDNVESLRISREARFNRVEQHLGDISSALRSALRWISVGGMIVLVLLGLTLIVGLIGWQKP